MGIIRKTKSVQTLLKLFEVSENALSVVQLIESTKNQMNKTTVYRVLDRLEKEGMVYSFTGIQGLKWYAKCLDCTSVQQCITHTNFQCIDCGNMESIHLQYQIPIIPELKINSAQIMLSGICSKCGSSF